MRLNLECALGLNGKGISAALMSYVNITAESNFRYIMKPELSAFPAKFNTVKA